MANQTLLPPADTLERYLAVRADQARLQPGVTALCERLGLRGADIVRFADGSLPVYAVGHNRVLKLYPGAFHDSYQVEHRVLEAIHQRLPIPTPGVEHAGEFEGWGYLLMERLGGQPLTTAWPHLSAAQRQRLAGQLGEALAALHAITTPELDALGPPDWDEFLAQQRASCVDRQRAAGLDPTWLEQIPAFLDSVTLDPALRPVLLHTEVMQPPDQDLLFAHLPGSARFHRERANQAKTTKQTRRDLAAFVDGINACCDIHGLPDRIPLVAGQRWHLTTSQFRRTLAWFIARRPGGVIAGAIAYRHHRAQVFEGYAGTSRSGFRAEVEAEEALERGERLLAMVEGYEHQQLVGPAAQEAKARLEEFGRQAGFAGLVVTDERRLQLIMRRHDPNIHPGKFVTCIHNPDKALCWRPQGNGQGNRQGPVLADCKPLACRNVALTTANLTAWREHLARLNQALSSAEVLAPYLRHRLAEQRDQVARFVDENGHRETDHTADESA